MPIFVKPYGYFFDELDGRSLLESDLINGVTGRYRFFDRGAAGDYEIYLVRDNDSVIYYSLENSDDECPSKQILDGIDMEKYTVTCGLDMDSRYQYNRCAISTVCSVEPR